MVTNFYIIFNLINLWERLSQKQPLENNL